MIMETIARTQWVRERFAELAKKKKIKKHYVRTTQCHAICNICADDVDIYRAAGSAPTPDQHTKWNTSVYTIIYIRSVILYCCNISDVVVVGRSSAAEEYIVHPRARVFFSPHDRVSCPSRVTPAEIYTRSPYSQCWQFISRLCVNLGKIDLRLFFFFSLFHSRHNRHDDFLFFYHSYNVCITNLKITFLFFIV